MQMVFQDPYSSLDPSMTIGEIIGEPLRQHEGLGRVDRASRVGSLLELVQLSPNVANRYPYEFSGGQRQRIAVARAIAARPKVIVCDEPVSALDVSTQNQIINLLDDLRSALGLSLLFIAHDLGVVRHISARVAVMYLGVIVEIGDTTDIFGEPSHPYTRALLGSIPRLTPRSGSTVKKIVVEGDVPDPSAPPSGCPFHPRCVAAMPVCQVERPALVQLSPSRSVACHLY
jgi:oligopeptide/dipeptide ABC transporter ATP-binding protein